MIAVREKLKGNPFKLVQPHRAFTREGEVIIEEPQKQKALKLSHFFLFSDILIQASPKKSSKFKYKRHFDLQFTKAIALPKESKPNSFRILTQDTGFTFSCNSPAEKEAWVNDINNNIFNLKKNVHNRRVASQKPPLTQSQ